MSFFFIHMHSYILRTRHVPNFALEPSLIQNWQWNEKRNAPEPVEFFYETGWLIWLRSIFHEKNSEHVFHLIQNEFVIVYVWPFSPVLGQHFMNELLFPSFWHTKVWFWEQDKKSYCRKPKNIFHLSGCCRPAEWLHFQTNFSTFLSCSCVLGYTI